MSGTRQGGSLQGAPGGSRASRLRLARLAHDLSQDHLAEKAGVTRQTVAGIEAGRWQPSLKVALRIASALGTSVEELFGSRSPGPSVMARVAEQMEAGAFHPGSSGGPTRQVTARVALGSVGGTLTAFPLAGDACANGGFRPASGVLAGRWVENLQGAVRSGKPGISDRGGQARHLGHAEAGNELAVRPLGSLSQAQVLIVAGCDPALPLLAEPLGALDPPVGLLWWSCSSTTALELLRTGLVHAGGLHLRSASPGSYNTPQARKSLADSGAEVIGFASWREGLAIAPKLSGQVETLNDVKRLGMRLVNREPGSEAHEVLERERRRLQIPANALPGYSTTLTGHLPVASAVASGLAEVGITSEPAAIAYGLDFVPLATERYDLVVRRDHLGTGEVRSLLQVLGSPALHAQLDAIDGYDASLCGTVVDAF